jgi:thioredoxin reductase
MQVAQQIGPSDVIAYFSGVRSPTYEEDFQVRKGIFCENILEAAGIQSPGATAAPAIAKDLAQWTVEFLERSGAVEKNTAFQPVRKGIPHLHKLSEAERDALIQQNPDYGQIVCRCEEISKGEILDALDSPLPVYTLDAIKRRCRPGMGRCQGSFCSPAVVQILAEKRGCSEIGRHPKKRRAKHDPAGKNKGKIGMKYDVTVIGGGPAGLAAAISAKKEDAKVLLIEREARLGGILKQCIHDGFGLVTFGEKLTGPEYCERYIDELLQADVAVKLLTFVTKIEKNADGFVIHFVNREGAAHVETKAIVLATGCRERTAKQVFIHGTRPSGVLTAGTAQYYVNRMGELPVKRCVVLGSGDIGLIMARRLTLEGAEVLGVYEAKPEPSGLTRNLYQCLDDFNIPLHLSHTVTRVFGDER